jgi:L-rhamnose isomerase/sugar isomerase
MGTNVAHIVAFLLDEKKLGGFHLNARHYGDDDLIVGSDNAWEVFLIFNELVDSGPLADNVAYMIDQSHNIEPKLEAMLVSVLNCQLAYAKALIVDRKALRDAQLSGDVLGAHAFMTDAFQTDVRPLLMKVREEANLPVDPVAALRADDYQERVARERGMVSPSGGGYPG